MRVIDKEVTGIRIEDLAEDFFQKLCRPNMPNNPHQYHGHYVAGKLERLTQSTTLSPEVEFIAHELYFNLETLIKGKPAELLKLHEYIDYALENDHDVSLEDLKLDAQFQDKIQKIFNYYKTFRDGSDLLNDWFDMLHLKVCPYCNENWVLSHETVNDSGEVKRRFLFDIDHYFPQVSYPFFTLSFYNLIPSCTLCNQRLKGKKEIVEHIHPYVDDMDKAIVFDPGVTSSALFYSRTATVNLTLKKKKYCRKELYDRADETYKFFEIEERYKNHEDYVRELMQKNVKYSKRYIDYLYRKGKGTLFDSRDEVVRMIAGNYTLSKDIHKRPLAKLAKDILTLS